MALVSHSQTDAHAMHLLALVDLAAPISRFHADASSAIAGGAARISALIQFMHHKRVNSAYHILCTSKPDFTSTTATIKTLKSASRTCENIPQRECPPAVDLNSPSLSPHQATLVNSIPYMRA